MYISPWTEERIDLLKQLTADGKLSCAQIAKEIGGGFSRNAIIGKQGRLGIARVRTRTPKDTTRKHRKRFLAERSILDKLLGPKLNAEPYQKRSVPIEPLNINIVALTATQCRWPTDDKDSQGRALFCGHDQTPHSSYCGAHFELSRLDKEVA